MTREEERIRALFDALNELLFLFPRYSEELHPLLGDSVQRARATLADELVFQKSRFTTMEICGAVIAEGKEYMDEEILKAPRGLTYTDSRAQANKRGFWTYDGDQTFEECSIHVATSHGTFCLKGKEALPLFLTGFA